LNYLKLIEDQVHIKQLMIYRTICQGFVKKEVLSKVCEKKEHRVTTCECLIATWWMSSTHLFHLTSLQPNFLYSQSKKRPQWNMYVCVCVCTYIYFTPLSTWGERTPSIECRSNGFLRHLFCATFRKSVLQSIEVTFIFYISLFL
jgi:hypothetical protein